MNAALTCISTVPPCAGCVGHPEQILCDQLSTPAHDSVLREWAEAG